MRITVKSHKLTHHYCCNLPEVGRRRRHGPAKVLYDGPCAAATLHPAQALAPRAGLAGSQIGLLFGHPVIEKLRRIVCGGYSLR